MAWRRAAHNSCGRPCSWGVRSRRRWAAGGSSSPGSARWGGWGRRSNRTVRQVRSSRARPLGGQRCQSGERAASQRLAPSPPATSSSSFGRAATSSASAASLASIASSPPAATLLLVVGGVLLVGATFVRSPRDAAVALASPLFEDRPGASAPSLPRWFVRGIAPLRLQLRFVGSLALAGALVGLVARALDLLCIGELRGPLPR